MDSVMEDRFVVFIRSPQGAGASPDEVERPLLSCASYEEAHRLARAQPLGEGEYVVRFVGPSGGGD